MQGECLGKGKLVFLCQGRAAAYFREAKVVQGECLGKGKPVFLCLCFCEMGGQPPNPPFEKPNPPLEFSNPPIEFSNPPIEFTVAGAA